MRVWTTMPNAIYEATLVKNGVYVCDESKCDMLSDQYFKKAYLWMANEMRAKIGAAPEGVQYPVWAWFRLHGKEARPNLRWTEFKNAPVPMVLLELEIEDDKVVLSNEEQWTCAHLNDAACCNNDEELDWYYDSVCASAKEREDFKAQSWRRVFDVQNAPNIQATFWEIRNANAKKVFEYNKREMK